MRRASLLVMTMLTLTGCSSNEYEKGPLGIRWKPSDGVKLQSEATEGERVAAEFSGGVRVTRVNAPALPSSGDLAALLAALQAAAKLPPAGDVQTARSGSIPAGPVVRWELQRGGDHTLVYYLPASDHYLVLTLLAPAAEFERRARKLELSLSSLRRAH